MSCLEHCPADGSPCCLPADSPHAFHLSDTGQSWPNDSVPAPTKSKVITRKEFIAFTIDANRLHRKGATQTSVVAARRIALKSGSMKARLLFAYASFTEGLTDEEAAIHAGLTLETLGWWQRSVELRTDGLIADTGQTRPSRATGNPRMVCVITELGKECLP